MKLPIGILMEECIKDGWCRNEQKMRERWVRDVRLLGTDVGLSPETLYLVLSDELPASCESNTHSLFLMHRSVGERLRPEMDALMVPDDSDLLQLLGKIQDIFWEFQSWERRLLDACAFGRDLQDILSISAEMTPNVIYIADMSFKVLVHTNNEMMLDTSATWRYQMAHGYLPVHVMKGMIESGEFEELNGFRQAATYYSKNFYVPFATKNIFYNNKPVAHLFVVNIIKRPSSRDLAVAQILGEFIEQHYFLMSEFKLNRGGKSMEALFRDILSGECKDQVLIQKQISLFDWSMSDDFCMALTDAEGRGENFERAVMYQIESNSDMKCFSYQGHLVVLQGNVSGEKREQMKNSLRIVARRYGLKICLGNVYHGFLELKTQYPILIRIMAIAKENHPAAGLYEMQSYGIHFLIDYISRTPLLSELCSGAAQELKRYDQQNSSDFFSAYLCYLLNDRNVVHTSQALHVHRNTLMYRLDKIRSIIDCSEDDPGQKIQMLLSMLLLDYLEKQRFDF